MIYLDHAATTPVPRAVADAMYEVLTEQFGNPSSQYPMGLEMKRRVEVWRKTVADALGCGAKQLFFTSCGTEADNWAVTAACWQNRHLGRLPLDGAAGIRGDVSCPGSGRLPLCGAGPRRRPAGHGAGVLHAGEQRAGKHLSHR